MNWKPIEHYDSELLENYQIDVPTHFYRSFSILFGSIRRKGDAIDFIWSLNQLMDLEKGGGKIKKETILNMRGESWDISQLSFYDKHHVIPSSRDDRPAICKLDQVVHLPEKFHAAWHGVFSNLHGKETIIFLEKIFYYLKREDQFDYSLINKFAEKTRGGKLSRA